MNTEQTNQETTTYYTVYKITNLINNNIYIGAHQTSNLDDGYMGSGLRIVRAIKKYGIENFKKEILHILETREEMYNKEAEIVNEDFVKRDDTYNLKQGGFGGISGLLFTEETKQKMRDAKKHYYENNESPLKGKTLSEETKQKVRDSLAIYYQNNDGTFKGKTHSEETKQKLTIAWTEERKIEHSERLKENNPMNSEKSKQKMRDSLKSYYENNDNPFLGKKHTEETRKKISESNKGRVHEKIACPHCDKIGGGPSMNKFHFDNCKKNPDKSKAKVYKKVTVNKLTCPHYKKEGSSANMKRYHFDNCKFLTGVKHKDENKHILYKVEHNNEVFIGTKTEIFEKFKITKTFITLKSNDNNYISRSKKWKDTTAVRLGTRKEYNDANNKR